MGWRERRITGGIGADDPFWGALEAGEFRLPRCAGCGRWTWPAHWRCGECGSWEFSWTPVDPTGTVYSWTRTWYGFDRTRERAGDGPDVVALVEGDGTDGARVLGILTGDEAPLKVGARVTGAVVPPAEKSLGYPSIIWSLA